MNSNPIKIPTAGKFLLPMQMLAALLLLSGVANCTGSHSFLLSLSD